MLFQPVVKVPRVESLYRCPGCSQMFHCEDHCASHLLKKCIRFRSDNDYESRRSFVTWIIDYFKTYTYGEQNPPAAVKINALLKKKIGTSLKVANLRVNIPELSNTICCPVCNTFFYNSEICLEHLFAKCLYAEDGCSSKIQLWLFDYFSTKSENNLAVLRDVFANYTTTNTFCKYCKTGASDEESLKRHFPCPDRRPLNLDEVVCFVCNFSAINERKLVCHIISKHIRCHNCGSWPKNGNADLVSLKAHLAKCNPDGPRLIRCPVCFSDVPVNDEAHLRWHLVNCKKQSAVRMFDKVGSSVFGKCDICYDQYLLCDIDAHLRNHLKRRDHPNRRQKRLIVSLNDLKTLTDTNSAEIRLCSCNGILR